MAVGFFSCAWSCAPEKDLSKEESIVLLDLVEAELHCSKADPRRSINFGGMSISFVGMNRSSLTPGRSVGPIVILMALCRVDLKTSSSLSIVRQATHY